MAEVKKTTTAKPAAKVATPKRVGASYKVYGNHGKGGSITFIATKLNGFDGKVTIEGSVDSQNWFPVETIENISTISHAIPYYRFSYTAGTKGECKLNVFGPGLNSVEQL